jgi:threonine aldolase
LEDDHENARKLAEGLADIKGLSIDPDDVKTNIVYFQATRKGITSRILSEKLGDQGIRVLPTGPDSLRAVTHYHVTSDDINYTLDVFPKVLK